MSESNGTLIAELPSPQLPVPEASTDTRLTTHVLVAELFVFGIGIGAPKRHPGFPGYSGLFTPAAVQLRLGLEPPTSVSVVAARIKSPVTASHDVILVIELPWSGITRGSGTPTPAPPK